MNTFWSTAIWDGVRASGFTAYGLLTLSMVFGLLLGVRWRGERWPRLITNDMHNFVTLLALVFGAVHGFLSWLDPFMRFRLEELFVPLVSHYRPLWMGLGITAMYLSIALVLSTWLRARIGYRLWRALHVGAFAAFALATVHGLGTGSDSRTVWAIAIYAAATAGVCGLTLWRLLKPAGRTARPQPLIAAAAVAAVAALALWGQRGPLRAGWNAIANGGHGSGARIALATRPKGGAVALPARFTASLEGTITTANAGGGRFGLGGDTDATITASLSGAVKGDIEILVAGSASAGGIVIDRSQVTLFDQSGTVVARGSITSAQGSTLVADVTPLSGSGPARSLAIHWSSAGSRVSGSVQSTPLAATGTAAGANTSAGASADA